MGINYAAGSIATGGTPSPSASVSPASALGQRAKKYSLQDINSPSPSQLPMLAAQYGPTSPQALSYKPPTYNTAANDWQSNLDGQAAAKATYAANTAAPASMFEQAAPQRPDLTGAVPQKKYSAFGGGDGTSTGTGAVPPATSALPNSTPTDPAALTAQLQGIIANSPYTPGSASYLGQMNRISQNVNNAYAGADQAATAMGAAGGRVSSASYGALAMQEANDLSAAQNEYTSPQNQLNYLGGVLGLRGTLQQQNQADVTNPLAAQGMGIANTTAAAMGPAQVAAVQAQTQGALQTQSQQGQLFGGQLTAQSLQNTGLGLQIQQQLGTLQSNITNAKSAADLSAAQAAEAKFKSDNMGLLTALGFVSSLAGPAAKAYTQGPAASIAGA